MRSAVFRRLLVHQNIKWRAAGEFELVGEFLLLEGTEITRHVDGKDLRWHSTHNQVESLEPFCADRGLAARLHDITINRLAVRLHANECGTPIASAFRADVAIKQCLCGFSIDLHRTDVVAELLRGHLFRRAAPVGVIGYLFEKRLCVAFHFRTLPIAILLVEVVAMDDLSVVIFREYFIVPGDAFLDLARPFIAEIRRGVRIEPREGRPRILR